MTYRKKFWTGIASTIIMIIMIIDSKTVATGAHQGVDLCLHTMIPSLFPFIVISSIANGSLIGKSLRILRPICKLCGIPQGGESILILGCLGGYPIGAQSIANTYNAKGIDKRTAHRLLGFCSNAGPAFIFGMLGGLFDNALAVWILWAIHIVSALIVGILLPNKETTICSVQEQNTPLSTTIDNSIFAMCRICGWIILFRIIICFLEKWLCCFLPNTTQLIISGFLEISNGCIELNNIDNQALRYIFCAGFLGFGGICVILQTMSVTKALGLGYYLPGKLLQSTLSVFLAYLTQFIIFPNNQRISVSIWILLIPLFIGIAYMFLAKKVVAFRSDMLYNVKN